MTKFSKRINRDGHPDHISPKFETFSNPISDPRISPKKHPNSNPKSADFDPHLEPDTSLEKCSVPKEKETQILFVQKGSVPKPELEPESVKTSANAIRFDKDQSLNYIPKKAYLMEEFASIQLSKHTKRAYLRDLKDFVNYWREKMGEDTDLISHCGPVQIARYRDHLINEKTLAKATVSRKLAVLKSFFKYLKANNYTNRNPAELIRGFPQTQDSKTGFLNEREILQLLNFFGPIAELKLSKAQAKIVIEILLMLAVRRSEAASINVGDIEHNDDSWLVKIKGKGSRDRLLPIPPRLLDTLSKWLSRICTDCPTDKDMIANRGQWIDWIKRNKKQPLLISTKAKVYTKNISPDEIAYLVRRYSFRAGLHQKVTPHMLRATAITSALDYGASHRGVQQMAGWTSPLMITRYDKRRNDPKHSAIHKLKFAKEKHKKI